MRGRSLSITAVMIAMLCVCASADLSKRELPPCGNYGALRVSRVTSEGLLLYRIEPKYPPVGRKARIQGEVALYVLMDTRGAVKRMCVLSGHPLLIPAAVEAVKRWRWKPFLLSGKPREIEFPVSVRFKLE